MRGKAVWVIVLPLVFAGCENRGTRLFEQAQGRYDGYTRTRDASSSVQKLVRAELTSPAPKKLALAVRPAGEADPGWDFELTLVSSKKLTLWSPTLLPQPVQLQRSEDDCYAPRHTVEPDPIVRELRLCFDGKELALDLQLAGGTAFALTVDRYVESDQPHAESPEHYSIERLRELAASQSFDSRIQFERVAASRDQALYAHLGLVPHVTVNDALGLISFNWLSLVRMVGNLAPFAFVNRWFRAHATEAEYESRKDALVVMKADAANVAEGLALAILRDEEAGRRLRSYQDPLATLRGQLADRVRLGLLPESSVDDLDSVVNSLQKTLIGLDRATLAEYAALAQAVGFVSPRAVASVLPADLPSIYDPITMNPDETGTLAIERSVELRQMDHLLEQARWERNARYFDWMDPSGAGGGIGVAIAPYIGVARHLLAELRVRREQTQSIVLQKVSSIGSELDASVKLHALSSRDIEIQQRRVRRIFDQLRLGIPVSFAELQLAFLQQMKADLDEVNARYEYGVAVSKLNRVLFTGPYLGLRLL